MPVTHPLTREYTAKTIALGAAVADVVSVCRAPYAGVVSAVSYVPDAAATGNTTNGRTLSLVNKGLAGAGAVSVASLGLITGVDLVAFDEKAITLSGTAANLVVAEGDVLAFDSTHSGTGVADPGGLVRVAIDRS